MDVREKLVELLRDVQYLGGLEEKIADHLIANGVTVQEDCKDCAEATQNCIVKLQEQIAELRSAQEWISVDDRLPEDASTVLAIDSDGTISSAYYVGRWHSGGDLDEDAVTYWMPLPTAPKEDK